MTDATIFGRFLATAMQWPDKPFLNVLPEPAGIYGTAAGEITYSAMLERVLARVNALAEAGFGEGTRVGLLLQNRPEFIELWFAANSLGASVVPINPDLRRSEIEDLSAHSELATAFVLPERRAEVEAAALAAGSALVPITPDDPVPPLPSKGRTGTGDDSAREAGLLYTSGTTGRPKGCVLTNEFFLHSGDWYRDVGGLRWPMVFEVVKHRRTSQ